jgi:hypothetical protein
MGDDTSRLEPPGPDRRSWYVRGGGQLGTGETDPVEPGDQLGRQPETPTDDDRT